MRIQVAGHNLYTIEQVANELGLPHQTIAGYIQSGQLDAWRVADGSLRIEESEWRRFAQVLTNKRDNPIRPKRP